MLWEFRPVRALLTLRIGMLSSRVACKEGLECRDVGIDKAHKAFQVEKRALVVITALKLQRPLGPRFPGPFWLVIHRIC